MKPTLLVGDYLFVSKFAYGYSRHSLPFSLPLIEGRIFAQPARARRRRGVQAALRQPDRLHQADRRPARRPAAGARRHPVHQRRAGGAHARGELPRRRRHQQRRRDALSRDPARRPQLHRARHHGRTARSTTPTSTRCPKVTCSPWATIATIRLDSRVPNVGFIPIENLIGRAEIIFFSTNGSARLWEVWKWPTAIRFRRLFQPDRVSARGDAARIAAGPDGDRARGSVIASPSRRCCARR